MSAPPPVALLLLDLQEPFLKAIPESEVLLQRCHFAAEAANLLRLHLVYTEQVPDKLGATLPKMRAVAPEAPVFGKTAFSAFGAEGFADWLREEGIEHLLLAGIETPICVYQTALDAMQHDLAVTLLSDCLGARRKNDAKAVLRFLRQTTRAALLPSETVLYALLRDALHPQFRAYTRLVKEHG